MLVTFYRHPLSSENGKYAFMTAKEAVWMWEIEAEIDELVAEL